MLVPDSGFYYVMIKWGMFQGCMSVSDVKGVFRDTAHKLGRRDHTVMGVSALKGYVDCHY